jgi:hypothetical protein
MAVAIGAVTEELKMLTKMKIALVMCGSLLCGVAGVAAAQPAAGAPTQAQKIEWKQKFEAKRKEMLEKFDTNKDGKLDDAERTAMRDQLTTERFKKLDTNNDGVLSLAEFKAAKQGKHHHMDGHARRGHRMGQVRGRGRIRGMGSDAK